MKKISFDMNKNHRLGISQRFFLLELYKIKEEDKKIGNLRDDIKILKQSQPFLYGFFGDYNLFGRRHTEYIPYKCYEVKKKIVKK